MGIDARSGSDACLLHPCSPAARSAGAEARGRSDRDRGVQARSRQSAIAGNRDRRGVYAVVDRNRDDRADEVVQVAESYRMPNGVAFKDGALYVADIDHVMRFDGVMDFLDRPPGDA
mgnify:CR=1 FL=1